MGKYDNIFLAYQPVAMREMIVMLIPGTLVMEIDHQPQKGYSLGIPHVTNHVTNLVTNLVTIIGKITQVQDQGMSRNEIEVENGVESEAMKTR